MHAEHAATGRGPLLDAPDVSLRFGAAGRGTAPGVATVWHAALDAVAGFRWWRMAAATMLTGLLAGVGGIALTELLHGVQHLAFGYTRGDFLAGVLAAPGPRRVAALTGGGLLVGAGWWWHRRRTGAQDVSVTHALRTPGTRLPVAGTIVDAVLQVVAVGAGASLGREGAPRQVGAALGGWIAGRIGVTPSQRRTLLACGAGAGLAAVYNVPAGGALFTLEILLVSAKLGQVVPAALSAVTATVTAWTVLGAQPTYRVEPVHYSTAVLTGALVVGPLAGVAGAGFHRLADLARTHAATGAWTLLAVPGCFTALGAVSIAYPQVLGNGKAAAYLAFTGSVGAGLGVVLLVLKPVATAACLSSGAIGGLLTPSLATGALLGAALGHLLGGAGSGAFVGAYAVLGAAAVLAVTQRAPLTAIALTLEFLHTGQSVIAPILVAVTFASATAWVIDPDTLPHLLRAAHLPTTWGTPT
ncbi:chloride channel protein [Flexivirga caeni]|uniref:Chloride channel protein n=1 Tax=Flexivirga caeni TaxID=2294115 RepID=A0A3M9MGY5_9MICO|nr:chloride channel protein [Flexivirga caeni]RNI24822.1 chloride channel protein [Flexivirga caeni]